jgi:hypothetical protein
MVHFRSAEYYKDLSGKNNLTGQDVMALCSVQSIKVCCWNLHSAFEMNRSYLYSSLLFEL